MVPSPLEDPAKQPVSTASNRFFKYRAKLTRCVLFYIVLPAIPIILIAMAIMLIMDTNSVKPTSLPSIGKHSISETPIERLPLDLMPTLYIITLQTFLPYKQGVDFGPLNRTVMGYVLLSFNCRKETNQIFLHANDLLIDRSKLRLHDQDTKESIDVELAEIRNRTHMLEFVTGQPMLRGHNYSMKVNYGTRMREPHEGGLFLATYHVGNETRYHMVSQMQPTEARRVFPCFDEPLFKAEFQIIVIHPRGTTAISNTELLAITERRDNWLRSEFHPTPKMSTYLLAVAVTDFSFIETRYRDIRIRLWAQPEHIDYTDYALNVLPQVLQYYESYFNILYPLSKLDIYAVQELKVAAMENWGLITAKDAHIVYHPNISGTATKTVVELTLFHEVAHMWFGNLITMRWWNDLWLNEGFATHLTACAGNNLTIEKDSMEYMNQIRTFNAMNTDEKLQTPALSFDVRHHSEITVAFSALTYYKGAAVLRQLETIVGAERFQHVLRDFILKHLYDNADSEDFIRSIIKSLGKSNPFGKHDVDSAIRSWTHNKGFPLVTVTRINSTSVQLSQRCFNSGAANNHSLSHTWTIPLYFKHHFDQDHMDVIMLHGNETLTLNEVAILDPDAMGYFKILYDPDTLTAIIQRLHQNHTVIPARTRAKLIYDVSTLMNAGYIGIVSVMELGTYLRREDALGPHAIFSTFVETLQYTFAGEPEMKALLKPYLYSILGEPFKRIITGSTSYQTHHDSMGRTLILKTCAWDYPNCIDFVRQEFSKLRTACGPSKKLSDSCNFIIPGFREAIYAMALRHGNVDDFYFLWEKLMLETHTTEKRHINAGLVGTLNETLIAIAFDYNSLNVTPVDQNFCANFYVASTLDVIRPHFFKQLRKLLGIHRNNKFMMKCINIAYRFPLNKRNLKKIETFFTDHNDLMGHPLLRGYKGQMISIARQLAIRARHASALTHYLNEYKNRIQNMTHNHTLTSSTHPLVVGSF